MLSATPALPPTHARHPGLVLALVVALLSIAAAAVFIREAAPTPPLVIAGWRLVLAGIAYSAYAAVTRGRHGALSTEGAAPKAVMSLAALGAGACYAVHFGAWISSLWLTTLAASTTLVTASPLVLALHGAVTGRDRPSTSLWLALGIAAVGVICIATGGDASGTAPAPVLGNALAFLGAGAMAVYLLLTRRLGGRIDLTRFSAIATLAGGAMLLALSLALGQSLLPRTAASVGWIVVSALIPQLLGHTLITWSMQHTTPTTVGLVTLGEPVVTTALGVWLYGEVPSAAVLTGCGLTLLAVVVTLRARR
ncbi:MAG: DMT family transporter [Myxococcales bacterium]|nr:DMT family transporter [Myxococcales bacterium]